MTFSWSLYVPMQREQNPKRNSHDQYCPNVKINIVYVLKYREKQRKEPSSLYVYVQVGRVTRQEQRS